MNVAFLYEHPTWSQKLIDSFRRNDIELKLIDIGTLTFDTGELELDFDLLINRVNIMPSADRNSDVVFHTLHFLDWVELMGINIINGSRAHRVGASKAIQNGIFSRLDLRFPAAIAIYRIEDAVAAANTLGYPVIIKPNIGGSGSDVARFDSAEELTRAIEHKSFTLGVDGSGLVQEYIQSDGYVYRVEILGDDLFYSIKQAVIENQFNYCAADGCSTQSHQEGGAGDMSYCAAESTNQIELLDVPPHVLQQVKSIVKSATADVGGVEYFMDQKTGMPCFYDFNPYSNFVGDGEDLLGFSPEQRFVDFIKNEMRRLQANI